MNELQAEAARLRVAIDAVVPADEFPSASQAGGLGFWARLTALERPEWADRVIGVLDLLDRRAGGRFADVDPSVRQGILDGLLDDPEYIWFATWSVPGSTRPGKWRQRRRRLLADAGLESRARGRLADGGGLGSRP